MQLPNTLSALIGAGHDAATAIHAPGGAPLSYAALRGLVAQTIVTLNGLGIGRGDRVAIVLPNGPEMATAFVALGSRVTVIARSRSDCCTPRRSPRQWRARWRRFPGSTATTAMIPSLRRPPSTSVSPSHSAVGASLPRR